MFKVLGRPETSDRNLGERGSGNEARRGVYTVETHTSPGVLPRWSSQCSFSLNG
jgi:hypothetical protein